LSVFYLAFVGFSPTYLTADSRRAEASTTGGPDESANVGVHVGNTQMTVQCPNQPRADLLGGCHGTRMNKPAQSLLASLKDALRHPG
jgi:hypothetical protein